MGLAVKELIVAAIRTIFFISICFYLANLLKIRRMRKHFLDIALLICVALPVMANLIGHLSSDARSVPGMTGRVTPDLTAEQCNPELSTWRVNSGLANYQSYNFFQYDLSKAALA